MKSIGEATRGVSLSVKNSKRKLIYNTKKSNKKIISGTKIASSTKSTKFNHTLEVEVKNVKVHEIKSNIFKTYKKISREKNELALLHVLNTKFMNNSEVRENLKKYWQRILEISFHPENIKIKNMIYVKRENEKIPTRLKIEFQTSKLISSGFFSNDRRKIISNLKKRISNETKFNILVETNAQHQYDVKFSFKELL